MSFLTRLLTSAREAATFSASPITGPLEVVHAVHVDADLNWTFDASVDPKTVFTKMKFLGSGGFGTVSQICHRPSMKILAGKIITPTLLDSSLRADIENEISLMREVRSPFTIQYYGSVPYDNSVMILMEYCDRGSFRDLLDARSQVLSEDQIAAVLQDVLSGLLVVQGHQVVHRDVKAANLLLMSSGAIRLSDFGVSRRFDPSPDKTATTIVGTPYWMAPEVIDGRQYGFPADVWSLGITVVELAEGSPPYIEFTPSRAMVEISTRGFPGWRYPDLHSPDICDFVEKCLAMRPENRWTVQQLTAHPFVRRAAKLDRQVVLAELYAPTGSPVKPPQSSLEPESFVQLARTMRVARNSPSIEDAVAPEPERPSKVSVRLPNRPEQLEISQRADQVFVVNISKVTIETEQKIEMDDATFARVSKAMSKRIPFVSMKNALATQPEQEVATLYTRIRGKLAIKIEPSKKLPPLFDRDGVISIDAAFRDPKAPAICAITLLLFAVVFFGKEGLLLLIALSFLVHMIVVLADKYARDAEQEAKNTPD
jgi:serine/threonine protein kinase